VINLKGLDALCRHKQLLLQLRGIMLKLPGEINSYHVISDATDDVSHKAMPL
jgi:hypothetical protein